MHWQFFFCGSFHLPFRNRQTWNAILHIYQLQFSFLKFMSRISNLFSQIHFFSLFSRIQFEIIKTDSDSTQKKKFGMLNVFFSAPTRSVKNYLSALFLLQMMWVVGKFRNLNIIQVVATIQHNLCDRHRL